MRFYQVYAEIKNNPFQGENVNRAQERDVEKKFCKITMEFSEETYKDTGLIFVSSKDTIRLSMGLIDEKTDAKKFAVIFFGRLGVEFSDLNIKEVSMGVFLGDLTYADRSGLIEDDLSFSMSLGIEDFYNQGRHSNSYMDTIVDEKKTIAELRQDAEDNFLGLSYKNELNRILKCKKQTKFVGHPAHYIIVSKNGDHRKVMARDMISALHKKGRLKEFRVLLNLYIRINMVKPLAISNGVSFSIKSDGRFTGVSADAKTPINKQTEDLFDYYCFLAVRNFWQEIHKTKDINYSETPLFIADLKNNKDIGEKDYLRKIALNNCEQVLLI